MAASSSTRVSDVDAIAAVVGKHVVEASEFQYTMDLKGPLDSDTILLHRRIIRDARELGTSFVQGSTAAAFDKVAAGFENPMDSQQWSTDEAKKFRAMMRHVEQSVAKVKGGDNEPVWLQKLLHPKSNEKKKKRKN